MATHPAAMLAEKLKENSNIGIFKSTQDEAIERKHVINLLNKLGSVVLLSNTSVTHSKNLTNWIVVSYVQQNNIKQVNLKDEDETIYTIQENVYEEITKFITNSNVCTSFGFWWDQLPGVLSKHLNPVWPAIANLHYISQPIIVVPPEVEVETTNEYVAKAAMVSRMWPGVERACAYSHMGVYILESTRSNILAMVVLLAIHVMLMLETTGNILSKVESFGKMKDNLEGTSTGLLGSYMEIFCIKWSTIPIRDHKMLEKLLGINRTENIELMNLKTTLKAIGSWIEVLCASKTIKDSTGHRYNRIAEEETIQPYLVITIKLFCIDTLTFSMADFASKFSPHQSETIHKDVDANVLKRVGGSCMLSDVSYGSAYCDGDKIMAALVYANIKKSVSVANKWLQQDNKTTSSVHPFTELVYNNKKISNQTWMDIGRNMRSSGPIIFTGYGNINKGWPEHIAKYEHQYVQHTCWPGIASNLIGDHAIRQLGAIVNLDKHEFCNMYVQLQQTALQNIVAFAHLEDDSQWIIYNTMTPITHPCTWEDNSAVEYMGANVTALISDNARMHIDEILLLPMWANTTWSSIHVHESGYPYKFYMDCIIHDQNEQAGALRPKICRMCINTDLQIVTEVKQKLLTIVQQCMNGEKWIGSHTTNTRKRL